LTTHTVLIAEDEPALLETFCELVSALGHDCIRAQDGNEALELAQKQRPHVIITDFMMPGRTGGELIRALRTDPELGRVPVILLSAGRPPAAARNEAWRFLPKPVTLDAFQAAIREALEVGDSQPLSHRVAPDVQLGPLTLAREAMLSWVAHEIKSPLSAALMASQLSLRSLENGEDPASLGRRLAIIARQLVRMDELVTSILDAARLDEEKLQLDLEPIDVAEWMRQVADYWKELNPDHDFPVIDGHRLIVHADRERLRQIVDNLISNAIKYGGPSRQVSIAVDANDSDVLISVTDRGPGIEAKELPHIFDRFHRVAGHGGRGHGLGLYIASALARLHGGNLSVESQVNHGSTFTLSIPRHSAEAGA
jgi:signal transduction histidine kinase